MWSLISQGKSSSFIGLPWDLFVEESRKSAFKSGEHWEVLRREEGAVIAGKEGVEKQLPPGQTWKFSVFEQQKVTLSIGDRIRFTKKVKGRGHKFLNNELRTVIDIEDGKIIFDKGEIVRLDTAFRLDQGCHQPRQPGQDCRPGHCQRAGSRV
jgi:hypothetical protein